MRRQKGAFPRASCPMLETSDQRGMHSERGGRGDLGPAFLSRRGRTGQPRLRCQPAATKTSQPQHPKLAFFLFEGQERRARGKKAAGKTRRILFHWGGKRAGDEARGNRGSKEATEERGERERMARRRGKGWRAYECKRRRSTPLRHLKRERRAEGSGERAVAMICAADDDRVGVSCQRDQHLAHERDQLLLRLVRVQLRIPRREVSQDAAANCIEQHNTACQPLTQRRRRARSGPASEE
eukprot:1850711-Rhodomonas_salina.1